MENEIMNNEDVMVVAEEVAPETSGTGWLIVAGVAGVALVGAGIYKLVKYIKTKRNEKKENKAATVTVEENVFDKDIDEE